MNILSKENTESVEYRTIESDEVFVEPQQEERLHEWLTSEDIEYLHGKFKEAKDQKLSMRDLRDCLERIQIKFTDMEWTRLFFKINQNLDFLADWDEFISYLIFGFQEDDPSSQKEALILPISNPPLMKKSEHRSQICAVTLLDTALYDEEHEIAQEDLEKSGIWLTASHEGQIRFWNTNLEPLRSSTSDSFHLKMPTWILAIQALSDVSVVCTSSTERELRFHETVASTFTLRIVIRHLPSAVFCLGYSFHPLGKEHSRLVLGDYVGNVRILEFDPYLRGPFQSKPGTALVEIFWTDVMKGKLPMTNVIEYLNIHSEVVQKVHFSIRLNCLFCAAEYRNVKKYKGRCPGLVIASNVNERVPFRIPLGVTTFSLDEVSNIVLTGGPDTLVRVWDVYIPSKPIGLLSGHNAGVVMVFSQPEETKIYSVDYHKIIKVWDLKEYTLLQSYSGMATLIPGEKELCYSYHAAARELLIGGRKLSTLKCCPRVRVDLTDGNTHAAPVSVVLYNHLFRNLVTCGLDSYIIIWDPYTGRRQIIMKNCHTTTVYGEVIDVEITAACFDPLQQFLLTGARDGTLKIWNYNNAVCVRNMSIKPEHQVTAVLWVVERILAVGWDRQVTEFNDVEGREYGDPKKWPTFHNDDITCADLKAGEGVVTATYSGEIIFWKLETGQPYRRYKVSKPTMFIELKYKKNQGTADVKSSQISVNRYWRFSHFNKADQKLTEQRITEQRITEENTAKNKKISSVLPVSVQAVLFLQTRPMTPHHGSVFVALDTGIVQVYSHHQRGGYIDKFNAVHTSGDCVLAMSTDRKNRYLFTGTAFGYIKTWHIVNYCVPVEEHKPVCMPLLRLQFIFLRKTRFLIRAKRATRNQLEPLLLNSYKAHLKAVNSIEYIHLPKILLTGSHDCSCRLWTLGGRYLGTLGTQLPWMKLSPFHAVDEDTISRMPPDIQKVASSTTMRIISGRQTEFRKVTSLKSHTLEELDKEDLEGFNLYGKPLHDPILGNHFVLPGEAAIEHHVKLDTAQSYIPVYSHLKIQEGQDVERPPTPPGINRIQAEEYMHEHLPPNTKDIVGPFPEKTIPRKNVQYEPERTNRKVRVQKKLKPTKIKKDNE